MVLRFAINVVENTSNEILLLKRSPRAQLGPEKWGFPAGHIETDETAEECSARELVEELGGQHRVELLRAHGAVRDSFYGGLYEIYLFHYRWLEGEIMLNPEHIDFAWVSCARYREFEVMDGIDEDLAYLNIWPRECLNQAKLPAHLRD